MTSVTRLVSPPNIAGTGLTSMLYPPLLNVRCWLPLRPVGSLSAQVAPVRLPDGAGVATLSAAPSGHPEVDGGGEREEEEDDDGHLNRGADDAVEHPAQDHPHQETGKQSATGPPYPLAQPLAAELHRNHPLSHADNGDTTGLCLTMCIREPASGTEPFARGEPVTVRHIFPPNRDARILNGTDVLSSWSLHHAGPNAHTDPPDARH